MRITAQGDVRVAEGLPVYQKMDGHYQEVPFYVSPDIFPGVPLRVAAVDAAQLVGKPHAELHHHDVAEVYLVLSPGLHFEIQTEQNSVSVASPAAVLIPAQTRHRFVVKEVKSSPCYFLGIFVDIREETCQ